MADLVDGKVLGPRQIPVGIDGFLFQEEADGIAGFLKVAVGGVRDGPGGENCAVRPGIKRGHEFAGSCGQLIAHVDRNEVFDQQIAILLEKGLLFIGKDRLVCHRVNLALKRCLQRLAFRFDVIVEGRHPIAEHLQRRVRVVASFYRIGRDSELPLCGVSNALLAHLLRFV